MTGTLWAFAGIVVAVALLAVGWVAGSRWTYYQLEKDTSGWQHPPVN